jgi:hypothetical protein
MDEIAARYYGIAAESRQELRQLEALRRGDPDAARQQIEAALDTHWTTLSRYEETVPPGRRQDFVRDVIAEARQYRVAYPPAAARSTR